MSSEYRMLIKAPSEQLPCAPNISSLLQYISVSMVTPLKRWIAIETGIRGGQAQLQQGVQMP